MVMLTGEMLTLLLKIDGKIKKRENLFVAKVLLEITRSYKNRLSHA